jgi:hypothetical protein
VSRLASRSYHLARSRPNGPGEEVVEMTQIIEFILAMTLMVAVIRGLT